MPNSFRFANKLQEGGIVFQLIVAGHERNYWNMLHAVGTIDLNVIIPNSGSSIHEISQLPYFRTIKERMQLN